MPLVANSWPLTLAMTNVESTYSSADSRTDAAIPGSGRQRPSGEPSHPIWSMKLLMLE